MLRALPIAATAALVALVPTAAPAEPMPELRPGRESRARDSVIELAGSVPLSAVESLARQHMPARRRWRAPAYTHPINGGAGTLDGISVGYDIVSGVASVRAGNRGQIVTVIPVTYSIWARYQPVAGGPSFDASCQRRAASLVLTTTLSVRDSKLAPSTRASVAARSRCVITRLQIDVTDLLGVLIGSQLDRATAEIDRRIADSLEIGGAAALAWRRLVAPQKVDGGWLELAPVGLQIPPIDADRDRLTATIQVLAKPRLILGGDPPARSDSAPPVPRIDSHSSPPALSVLVDVSISDRSIDAWATRAARQVPKVRGVRVRPSGRRVAVGVEVRGAGQVWMTGDLLADASGASLAIGRLALTAPSRARLAAASIDARALERAMSTALASFAPPELDDLRPRVQDALTSSLSAAVPLLSGGAAVERVSFASAVRERGATRILLRAEGQAIAGRACSIRAAGEVSERDVSCTRAAARAHCGGDKRCAYAADGKTWLPVF